MIRLACDLAVVCGVSLRHIALLFAVLFLIPISKSSMKRWIDDIGVHVPTPEEMLRQLLALAPVTECHIDGYYPLGTDHGWPSESYRPIKNGLDHRVGHFRPLSIMA